MSERRSQTGVLGENAASDYLIKHGYRILHRNYRQKSGEIDIICEYEDILAFVEVKTRRNTHYGFPSEAVTYRKQQKILSTALMYLSECRIQNQGIRFDVIEVLIDGTRLKFNHIINAFGR